MIPEDFDPATGTVYEVWNWTDDDPLAGIFVDEAKADEFCTDLVLETGDGKTVYYPPTDRYADKPVDERAETFASELLTRLKALDLDEDRLPIQDVEAIPGAEVSDDLDLDAGEDSFEPYVSEPFYTDEAREVARSFRTAARIRHLRVYDEIELMNIELALRSLLSELNEEALDTEDGEGSSG